MLNEVDGVGGGTYFDANAVVVVVCDGWPLGMFLCTFLLVSFCLFLSLLRLA